MSHIANDILTDSLLEFSEIFGVSPKQLLVNLNEQNPFPPKVDNESTEDDELDFEDARHQGGNEYQDYKNQEIRELVGAR